MPAEHDTRREAAYEPEPLAAPDLAPREPGEPLRRLAGQVGNRAFGETLARQGAGILADGEVHPDVQRTLDTTRGGGSTLDGGVQTRFAPDLGDLSDVRVHTDETADGLNRAVSARAFATGTDVYFARGEYRPGTPDGDRLLAHELAHVVQQRGAAASGPLRVSEPGDELERDADRTAGALAP